MSSEDNARTLVHTAEYSGLRDKIEVLVNAGNNLVLHKQARRDVDVRPAPTSVFVATKIRSGRTAGQLEEGNAGGV